ncbi:MAG: alpha/beta hydrolase, partial [Variovorax paradoxus]
MQATTLPVDGSHRIAVRHYPATAAPRASVVIGGAMGVRQAFYAPFAQWLAAQGVAVWTFDYRGSGDSLGDAPLRGFDADLFDWA